MVVEGVTLSLSAGGYCRIEYAKTTAVIPLDLNFCLPPRTSSTDLFRQFTNHFADSLPFIYSNELAIMETGACTIESDDESPHRKRRRLTKDLASKPELPSIHSCKDLQSLLTFEQDAGPQTRQSKGL